MIENLTPAQEGPDYGAFVSQDMDSSCEHDMRDLFICSLVTGHGDAHFTKISGVILSFGMN